MHGQLERAQRANDDLRQTRNDRWYPAFHLAPAAGWMNDPNGVCYYQGRYHVFYQHHPYGPTWGPMHWGHLSSADLLTWRHEPIALAPGDEVDADGVWSGSAVVSDDDTLMVYYTGHRWRNGVDQTEGNLQVQCLAESTDGIHLDKKGVIVEGPADLLHFRDPKVWQQDGIWYMVFAASSADERGQIWLYTSTDMRTWEFDRILFEDPDPDVYMIECPDLFRLGDRWVISYGPMSKGTPKGYGGRNGHNTGYVVGEWKPGEAFTQLTDYRPADWGHHFYAPQTFAAPDGRRIMFGWMGGFTLPLASQAEDGWSGQLAVPREVSVGEDGRLRFTPLPELEQLRSETVDFGSFEVGVDETRVLLADAGPVEIELVVNLADSTSEQVCLDVHKTSPAHFTRVAYDDLASRVVLDRGTNSATDRGYRAAPYDGGDQLVLRVFVDRGSVEVFVGDGAETISSLSFPPDGPRAIELSSVSGSIRVESLKIHRLGSIWGQE